MSGRARRGVGGVRMKRVGGVRTRQVGYGLTLLTCVPSSSAVLCRVVGGIYRAASPRPLCPGAS